MGDSFVDFPGQCLLMSLVVLSCSLGRRLADVFLAFVILFFMYDSNEWVPFFLTVRFCGCGGQKRLLCTASCDVRACLS